MNQVVRVNGSKIVLSIKKSDSRQAVIFSHGFLSSKSNVLFQSTARSLARAGIKSVLFNYHVERVNKRVSILEGVIDHVSREADSVGLLGNSLGGMVSIILAKHPAVKSLALINTVYEQKIVYDNYARVKKRIARVIPKRFMQEFFYPDLKKMIEITGKPVLVVSSERDRIVPQDMMKRLYNDVSVDKRFVSISNATHNLWKPSHVRLTREAVRDWFKETL